MTDTAEQPERPVEAAPQVEQPVEVASPERVEAATQTAVAKPMPPDQKLPAQMDEEDFDAILTIFGLPGSIPVRGRHIIGLKAFQFSNKQIADKLDMTPENVKYYIKTYVTPEIQRQYPQIRAHFQGSALELATMRLLEEFSSRKLSSLKADALIRTVNDCIRAKKELNLKPFEEKKPTEEELLEAAKGTKNED